jgi:hypothetical protein
MRQCFARLPTAESSPAAFTRMWRASTFGWTGGDIGYSRRLPDGRTVWLFGDSFIGGYDGVTRRYGPLIHNTFVIQSRRCLTTLRRGTGATLGDFVEPTRAREAGQWFWPGDTLVAGRTLQVVLARMGPDPTGFGQRAGTDIARFRLPGLRLLDVRPVPGRSTKDWGAAVLAGRRYTYIYGVAGDPLDRHLVVARVRGHRLSRAWQYRTRHGYSHRAAAAAPVLRHVSNAFSVLLLTQGPLFDRSIRAYTSRSPTGPWAGPTTVGRFPRPAPATLSYNGVAHPEWTGAKGELLLSTSVIGRTWEQTSQVATSYMPQFVRVGSLGVVAPDDLARR